MLYPNVEFQKGHNLFKNNNYNKKLHGVLDNNFIVGKFTRISKLTVGILLRLINKNLLCHTCIRYIIQYAGITFS